MSRLKKISVRLLLAIMLAAPDVTVFAGAGQVSPPSQALPARGRGDPLSLESFGLVTHKSVLENGLTVLVTPMPASPVVSVFILVKAGSATEGKYLGSGITHFLEHMLFKGTEKREAGDIPKAIQALGGEINASTGFDSTVYTITLPPEGVATALDILADMTQNARFAAGEIEREREVIISEMRMRRDNPDAYLGDLVNQTAYIRHPYRIPVIGREELLRNLTREDLLHYYRKFYVPNNMILTIAGKVDEKELLPQVKAAFGGRGRGFEVSRSLPPEPEQIAARRYEEEYPTELTRLVLAYKGVSLLDDDMFALDILSSVLAAGESSRLYQDLFRERRLVRSVGAFNYTPADEGLFEISLTVDEERIAPAVLAVKGHINKIQQEGVRKAELEKVRRQVLSEYIYEQETSGHAAYQVAADEALTGDPGFARRYVAGIKAVTNSDIRRVARRYLRDQRLSTVILIPKAKAEAAVEPAVAALPEAGEVERTTLANGLVILSRENHTLPTVTIYVGIKAGNREEPAELNGLVELTSRLWIKGTAARPAEDIAREVESRGAGLGPFAGRNSFGFSLTFLADDLEFGLDLLEDLLLRPAFPAEELAKEKDRVKTAIHARADSITYLTMKELRETIFAGHPFRYDELGSIETVERITHKDVLSFHHRFFAAGNMAIAVFGDFNSDEMVKSLTGRLASLPLKAAPPLSFPPPAAKKYEEKERILDKEQAMVAVGFQSLSFYDPDFYSAQVLAAVLGSSFNGRIFNTIREKFGQAYTLGGGYLPAKDTGMFYFWVQTSPDKAGEVKKILLDLLEEIRHNPVPVEELKEFQAYLKGQFKMDLRTNSALGFHCLLDEILGLGFDRYKSFDREIDRVTPVDVQRVAGKYLDQRQAVVIVTRPKM